MKLANVFDGMARENQFLRTVTKLLIIVTVALLGIVFNLYDRNPIVVERTPHGLEIVRSTDFARTEVDLKQAISLMIKARFSSDSVAPEIFLNPRQLLLRDTEQKDMKARGLTQSIVVRNVSIEKDQAVVDLDRVISIGEVRSALKAKVRVSFEEVSPNELNPYGLLLSLADPIEQKEVPK
jgi:hypothetical protein